MSFNFKFILRVWLLNKHHPCYFSPGNWNEDTRPLIKMHSQTVLCSTKKKDWILDLLLSANLLFCCSRTREKPLTNEDLLHAILINMYCSHTSQYTCSGLFCKSPHSHERWSLSFWCRKSQILQILTLCLLQTSATARERTLINPKRPLAIKKTTKER